MHNRKTILLLSLIMYWALPVPAQNCKTDTLMTIVSKWKKLPDANMEPDKNMTQIINRLDRISKMFLTTYPEPRGSDARWYRTMSPYPLVPGGPRCYNFESSLRLFYCNKNVDQVLIDERANGGHVRINSLVGFLWDQQDMIRTKVEGNDVYILPNPVGEWNGYPVYGYDETAGGMRSLLLMHKNKLPWIPVTQMQYLTALKKDWQEMKRQMVLKFDKEISSLQKSIREYENNKELPQAHREEIIASLKKGIENWENSREPEVARSDAYWNAKIEVIDQYMEEHKKELNEPAIVSNGGGQIDDFTGKFSRFSNGGHNLVVLNPAYFDKSLPSYIPQLMVLSWSWFNEPAGWLFRKTIEENFPIHDLEAMFGK